MRIFTSTPIDTCRRQPSLWALTWTCRAPLACTVIALSDEFKGAFSRETVQEYVAESAKLLEKPKFEDFVPLFLYRFTRERLRALAQVEGRIAKGHS